MSALIDEDELSHLLDIREYDTHGFGQGFPLRRHKHEAQANVGSHEARLDWIRLVGPVDKFGCCNPVNGHCGALAIPLCSPDKLGLVGYLLEYTFMLDNVLESATKAHNGNSGSLYLDKSEAMSTSSVTGAKQIQAKIALKMTEADEACAKRVLKTWEEWVSTMAKHSKTDIVQDLEEYIEYRIIDIGGRFMEALMLFGMGMQLSKNEDLMIEHIIRPWSAALGLVNDYFSFDREYEEFQQSEAKSITNCVWLFMQWEGLDVETAKERVKEETIRREQEFHMLCKTFEETHGAESAKLVSFLRCLSYQVSANVVWSLNCPRYHPNYRYDPNSGVENSLLSKDPRTALTQQQSGSFTTSTSPASGDSKGSIADGSSCSPLLLSPTTQCSSAGRFSPTLETSKSSNTARSANLCLDHVSSPFEYISTLPSKNLRSTMTDAINIWLQVPESVVDRVKSIIDELHNASLMLDDIEDGSNLRRGMPAAHKVFGTPLTINSANFAIIRALEQTLCLNNHTSLNIYVEEMKALHVGQSHDLYWTQHGVCPSEDEYMAMVDKKTGGLFRLLTRLLVNSQDRYSVDQLGPLESLVTSLGRYFQIRDDYQNLNSPEYTDTKGFCEDFDEAKFSFPLVHALNTVANNYQLRGLLQQARATLCLSQQQKHHMLELLRNAGSFEYTRNALAGLEKDIERDIGRMETLTRCENWCMRWLLRKLRV